ncbi:MAG: hypothetical protein ACXU9M_14130, partial [Thermodesulfobacteriota bacterium]
MQTYRVSSERGACRELEAKAMGGESRKAHNARRRLWANLGALFLAFSVGSCAPPTPTVMTDSWPSATLPPDKLAKYNDTFDRLRGD